MTEALELTPAFSEKNIPIVFCFDTNFVPLFSVTLVSLLDSATSDKNYDLVVFEHGITALQKEILLSQIEGKKNFSLRFVSMDKFFESSQETDWFVQRLSLSAYSRLFTPVIMRKYAKVVYLDSDIIVRADIADLFSIDIANNVLAAVRDFHDKRNLVGQNRVFLEKAMGITENLGDYFNSGVLIFNITAINRLNLAQEFVQTANRLSAIGFAKFRHDQDVLNSVCHGKTYLLDPEWNAQWYVLRWPDASTMTNDQAQAIMRNAKILHYTVMRPNTYPHELGVYWWRYARKSPFYESLIITGARQMADAVGEEIKKTIDKGEKRDRFGKKFLKILVKLNPFRKRLKI